MKELTFDRLLELLKEDDLMLNILFDGTLFKESFFIKHLIELHPNNFSIDTYENLCFWNMFYFVKCIGYKKNINIHFYGRLNKKTSLLSNNNALLFYITCLKITRLESYIYFEDTRQKKIMPDSFILNKQMTEFFILIIDYLLDHQDSINSKINELFSTVILNKKLVTLDDAEKIAKFAKLIDNKNLIKQIQ